jgi:DNA polymerase I
MDILNCESIYDYYKEIEQPCAGIFAQMSNRGIVVDLNYLRELRETLKAQKSPIEEQIKNELGNINLNSPRQLLEALNEKGIYPHLKGKPSTDKRALAYLRETPVITNLKKFSEIETLLTSFCKPYIERNESIAHPFFNQCGTRTGRLSCSNPNLLQIPKHTENGKLVRKMFVARPGMLLGDCDFGQIEPRVLAHLSKDPNMLSMFNNGIDFHEFTAEKLCIDRQRAKILNLSVGYRATFKSVSQQLKCGDSEAQNEIDKWWSLFPTLRRWQDGLIYESKRSGFCTTLLGRRIRIEDLAHGNQWRREGAERQLINNITQGSAAEIMKLAMIRINEEKVHFSPSFGLLIQAYDELLFESTEIDADIQLVQMFMQEAITLDVPLVVDCKTGPNWGEVQ